MSTFKRVQTLLRLGSNRYLGGIRGYLDGEKYDIVVVGGGIVGVAAAREIKKRHPHLKMCIVEKEDRLAVHQSGHNSGVIHAGIYYKPGSLKAKLCVEGLHLSYKYLDEKKVPYKKVGKLIVATDEEEQDRLLDLYRRGQENKVPGLELIEGYDIPSIEPLCTGVKAILSPQTGIVDWALVTNYYGDDFKEAGGDIEFNFEVSGFNISIDSDYPVEVISKRQKKILAGYVLSCGGLQSDKLAELSGCSRSPRIVPFRGEYLLLNEELAPSINGNIYPVPDPRFPFLGVHFTPRMDGSVWLGPNAVLAFSREGYRWRDINIADLYDSLQYPGMQKLGMKYIRPGLKEMRQSLIKSLQVDQLRKFVPSLKNSDVKRGPSGVRAQALDIDGNLVDDFYFDEGKGMLGRRVLHCRNAPSPAATSSLAIGKMIADKIKTSFQIAE